MTVSIIVPTYNGIRKLPGILECLAQQSFKDFETIVVIDGSTDGSSEMLAGMKTNLQLKILERENGGRSTVRNYGAAMAGGELLIFFDDDMLPSEHCVETHVSFHEGHRDSIVTGAQIFTDDGDFFSTYKNSISNSWANTMKKYAEHPMPPDQLYLTAANFSISKQLFRELGGFDERLTDAEDFDLAVRASKKGIKIYYRHDAFAWHKDNVDLVAYIKRLREYEKAHAKLRTIKSDMYSDVALRKPVQLKGFKKLAFSFFAHPFWLKMAGSEKFTSLLPVNMRQRLFDIVTHAYGVFFTRRSL
jgi:GT2 family glycosyltransferase